MKLETFKSCGRCQYENIISYSSTRISTTLVFWGESPQWQTSLKDDDGLLYLHYEAQVDDQTNTRLDTFESITIKGFFANKSNCAISLLPALACYGSIEHHIQPFHIHSIQHYLGNNRGNIDEINAFSSLQVQLIGELNFVKVLGILRFVNGNKTSFCLIVTYYNQVKNKTVLPYDLYKYDMRRMQILRLDSIHRPACMIPSIDSYSTSTFNIADTLTNVFTHRFWCIPFERCIKSHWQSYSDYNSIVIDSDDDDNAGSGAFISTRRLQQMNTRLIGVTHATPGEENVSSGDEEREERRRTKETQASAAALKSWLQHRGLDVAGDDEDSS